MVKEFISQLPPDKLSPFAKHPYQVREDAAMDELVESIRVHGILSPLLARPKGEGYELVSGHRRRLAARESCFMRSACDSDGVASSRPIKSHSSACSSRVR